MPSGAAAAPAPDTAPAFALPVEAVKTGGAAAGLTLRPAAASAAHPAASAPVL